MDGLFYKTIDGYKRDEDGEIFNYESDSNDLIQLYMS